MILIDFQGTYSKVKVKPLLSDHCVVRSISFDPFTWSIPNLFQGLPSMSRWSLLIFRSHVQRSRSNYININILIPWWLASYRFCFYREDKLEFCTMGGIDVSETFLVKMNFLTNEYVKWQVNIKIWQVVAEICHHT